MHPSVCLHENLNAYVNVYMCVRVCVYMCTCVCVSVQNNYILGLVITYKVH